MAVMTIRSDFLGQLQSATSLTARFEEFSLGPMPLSRIPQVIEGPARRTGLRVEDEFVQQAAHDAETEDALPLLPSRCVSSSISRQKINPKRDA
jgi:hypothetical protein